MSLPEHVRWDAGVTVMVPLVCGVEQPSLMESLEQIRWKLEPERRPPAYEAFNRDKTRQDKLQRGTGLAEAKRRWAEARKAKIEADEAFLLLMRPTTIASATALAVYVAGHRNDELSVSTLETLAEALPALMGQEVPRV